MFSVHHRSNGLQVNDQNDLKSEIPGSQTPDDSKNKYYPKTFDGINGPDNTFMVKNHEILSG